MHLGHDLMSVLVVYSYMRTHTHFKTLEKNFAPGTRIVVVTRRFVTIVQMDEEYDHYKNLFRPLHSLGMVKFLMDFY
jgi:hypothetical protein